MDRTAAVLVRTVRVKAAVTVPGNVLGNVTGNNVRRFMMSERLDWDGIPV
ncbi:MAG: hypothetical protein LH631_03130 [Alkalinema sp. CAN_BIN05]|nr:hypothetical protein [Alkalinema sp. CAN_BIN05]